MTSMIGARSAGADRSPHQRLELRDEIGRGVSSAMADGQSERRCARRRSSPSACCTAVRILAADASGDSRTPAPWCTTRAAVSFWSRPIGMQTIGTPAARVFIVVPCPQCDTASDAWARIWRWGAEATTTTLSRGGHLVGVEHLTHGHDGTHRQGRQRLDDPPQERRLGSGRWS